MRYLIVVLALLSFSVYAADGLVAVKSPQSVKGTADRLESALKEKGVTVIARVNHSQAATKAGMDLRPTEVVIFGNPKAGTPLMQCAQTFAIDLPQKTLIWEDEKGQTWLAYNDQQYLAKRHGITKCEEALRKMSDALANFAKAATKQD